MSNTLYTFPKPEDLNVEPKKAVRINIPQLKKDREFEDWLSVQAISHKRPKSWTWHTPDQIDEYSDLIVWMERGEGSNSDMPEHVWKLLIDTVGADYIGLVWITFLGKDNEN